MLILAIISFGMMIGAVAQWILGQNRRSGGIDWAMALIAGLGGSFVGGLLFSLIAGDGSGVQAERRHRLADRRAAGDLRLELVAPARSRPLIASDAPPRRA